MGNYYNGEKGCLRYIVDILDDCDGCNSIKSLKDLINEIRKIAIRGVVEEDNFNVKTVQIKNKKEVD